jgi:hypothetical protein
MPAMTNELRKSESSNKLESMTSQGGALPPTDCEEEPFDEQG